MADYVLSAELSLKDKFTSKINEATKSSEKFKTVMEKVGHKLKDFGDAKKLDTFVNKINTVTGKINKLAINSLKIGAIGGAGILAGASKIGADFEALGARMNTAFQGNKQKAAEYYKWANQFANQTPFENEEVIDAVVRLKSYGYEDPGRLMTILGDMAGAYGKTLEQSVEAYADASRGEFERLKEFGIQKDEVLKYAKETMGKEVKMSGEKVKDMDTFMKALEGLIKSRSKDGMKHLANTLSGMLSTTKGLLKYNISKLVGVTDEGEIRAGSLMDRIKQKFEKFNSYMQSPEGKKAIDKWTEAFDNALPQIIKLAETIKDKFKEIAGENFIEKLNESIKNFDPKSFNEALDKIQEKMDFLMDTVLRIGGALAGSKLGPLGTIAGFFLPEGIDAKNMVEEMKDDPNGEKAEKYKRTTGGGIFLKLMKHDDIMRQIQEQQDAERIEILRSFTDKLNMHEKIKTEHSVKLEVNVKGADNLNSEQIKKIAQETFDKTFSILTDEIEFA